MTVNPSINTKFKHIRINGEVWEIHDNMTSLLFHNFSLPTELYTDIFKNYNPSFIDKVNNYLRKI